MMMLPVAIAGMFTKSFATALIKRLGYRQVLVGNTILVGLLMTSFALISLDQPLWMRLVQLAAFGMVNSLQFTAMNSVTLKDLDGPLASSGNGLLSMVQMLAMGMGVAAAGAVLSAYTGFFTPTGPAQTLRAFHATFATMGLMTVASAWIFWQLPPGTQPSHQPKEESIDVA